MAAAQTAPAGSASDQSGQSSSTGSSSSAGQSQTGAAAGTSSTDQNAAGQSSAGTAADQNAPAKSNAQGSNLPQTGSELPILALLGVGTLSAGVWKAYYKK